jgi:N-acetylmuramoyl-L-alanine amidase
MIVGPKIRKALLPVNTFSRPGRKLIDIRGVVVHWTGNAGATADFHVSYFNQLAKQSLNDDIPDRYAGAHYFVDIAGEIVQLIPDDEMAYHVGAKEYNQEILNHFNTTYPNNCLIGVELCHPNWDGKFTDITLKRSVHLIAYLIEKYDLTLHDVVRHYDVTGKNCPKWFVENEDAYDEFRHVISDMLTDSIVHNKKLRQVEHQFHK